MWLPTINDHACDRSRHAVIIIVLDGSCPARVRVGVWTNKCAIRGVGASQMHVCRAATTPHCKWSSACCEHRSDCIVASRSHRSTRLFPKSLHASRVVSSMLRRTPSAKGQRQTKFRPRPQKEGTTMPTHRLQRWTEFRMCHSEPIGRLRSLAAIHRCTRRVRRNERPVHPFVGSSPCSATSGLCWCVVSRRDETKKTVIGMLPLL